MDNSLLLPILGGAILVLMVVVGTVFVFLKPSDTQTPPPKS
jgi:hypothetical protein